MNRILCCPSYCLCVQAVMALLFEIQVVTNHTCTDWIYGVWNSYREVICISQKFIMECLILKCIFIPENVLFFFTLFFIPNNCVHVWSDGKIHVLFACVQFVAFTYMSPEQGRTLETLYFNTFHSALQHTLTPPVKQGKCYPIFPQRAGNWACSKVI